MEKNVPLLVLEDATVRYAHGGLPERDAAIEDISFAIYPGSWTAIVGGNGSGKSTLSKALAGLCPLSAGRRRLPEGCAVHMVMQQPETQILGETVGEELRLIAPGRDEAALRGDAAAAGLLVPLDAPVKRLSGGQKQLLNLAGCLAADADAIVFDEATSMLDPSSRRTVLAAAARLRRAGRTIVWVTHRLEELREADRVIALSGGRIAFEGAAEAFFYGDGPAEAPSPCERLGFEPPYVVRAARALLARGVALAGRPIAPAQFGEAVKTLVR